VQKVIYGHTNELTEKGTDIRWNEQLSLGIIVLLIVAIGIYPQPLLDLTKDTTNLILNESNIIPFLRK
jgi:NADH-quinone oxidoreductase subunit M